MSWHWSTSGLCQIPRVNHHPRDMPKEQNVLLLSTHDGWQVRGGMQLYFEGLHEHLMGRKTKTIHGVLNYSVISLIIKWLGAPLLFQAVLPYQGPLFKAARSSTASSRTPRRGSPKCHFSPTIFPPAGNTHIIYADLSLIYNTSMS